jgi:hypothetical protein
MGMAEMLLEGYLSVEVVKEAFLVKNSYEKELLGSVAMIVTFSL